MEKHYLQIDFSTGNFYEFSKEAKDSYELHEGKTSDSYRKYYKGISGTLENASLRDGNFGQSLSLCLKNEEDIYYVQTQLYNQRQEVDQFAQSIICYLPNLKKGMEISLKGYNFTPKDSKYKQIGIKIESNGQKVERAVSFKDDVPKLEFAKKAGKNRPTAVSVEKRNDFFIEVMEKALKELAWDSNGQQTDSAPKEKVEPKKETVIKPVKKAEVKVDEQDLPF